MSRAKMRERRFDRYGPIVAMAEVDGWLLVRRPRKTPGAMSRNEWDGMSRVPVNAVDIERAALRERREEGKP